MENIRPEDLGSMGESFFETLCKSAGFIANYSNDDKGGWDFEIEHPRHSAINYSSHSYPVYRVQVKTTSINENKFSISFSNLLNLVQYSGAAFIFLVKYKEKMFPDNAYLFHIDKKFAIEILTEIRNKQLKDKNFLLNKRKRVVRFTELQEIKPLNGQGLKLALEKYIEGDYLKYVDQKVLYLSKLEKEGQKKQYTVKTKSESDLEYMARCFLGYNEEFKADSQSYNAPFGIRDKEPYFIAENYLASIRLIADEIPKATVYLKNSKFGKQYIFDGVIYAVPKQLPVQVAKMRIKTALFDILINVYSGEISFQSDDIFSANIKVKFKELYNYFCFLYASSNSEETYVKIESPGYEKPLELCLRCCGFELPSDFYVMLKAIQSTYLKLRDLNLEDKEISTGSIWEQIGHFYLLSIMNQKYEPEYILDFEHSKKSSLDINVVIFKAFIKLEGITLVFFVVFFGEVERIKDEVLRGRFNKSEFLGEYVIEASVNIDETLKSESKRYEEELIKRGFKVLD